jgi:hypothetical protein
MICSWHFELLDLLFYMAITFLNNKLLVMFLMVIIFYLCSCI